MEWNLWFYATIIHAASAVLNDDRNPERRMYCLFYAQICMKLQSSIVAVDEVGKAILALGYNKGVITGAEAVRLTSSFKAGKHGAEQRQKRTESIFTMDANLAGQIVPTANIDTLVGQFEELVLLSEFTEGVV